MLDAEDMLGVKDKLGIRDRSCSWDRVRMGDTLGFGDTIGTSLRTFKGKSLALLLYTGLNPAISYKIQDVFRSIC